MHPRLSQFAATFAGALAALFIAVLYGCGRGGGGGCAGPALPVGQLQTLRKTLQAASGPRGALVLPNPVDATGSLQVMATDARLQQFTSAAGLADLVSPQRLENSFLKVRIKTISDAVSTLAAPNAQGVYAFNVLDPHYSETMAYYAIETMMHYVETLGFPVVKSRPLYALVRAESKDPKEVNAFYDHNYLNPRSPRILRVFGDTQFPLGADRDIFWHEFGHLFNESASHEKGIDFAADSGANYTEGSSLHECLADMLAMSVGNKPYIGRWTARNFNDVPAGQPLRAAADGQGRPRLDFKAVIRADGRGNSPARYTVSEWCTRVLWDIRTDFVGRNPESGSMEFERMVWSAVGLLPKDTSFLQFHDALLTADEKIHCGGHEDAIRQSFQKRGFSAEAERLDGPLTADASPVGIAQVNGQAQYVTPGPGTTVVFNMRILNNSRATARNVRFLVEPLDRGLLPITYMQAYGDVAGGQSIGIGQGGQMDYSSSPKFEIDRSVGRGTVLRYRVHFIPENGAETKMDKELRL